MLMYPSGAESVKCSVCHYVTDVDSAQQQEAAPPSNAQGLDAPNPSAAAKESSEGNGTAVSEQQHPEESKSEQANQGAGGKQSQERVEPSDKCER